MTTIIAKTRKADGKLVRVHPDGRETVLRKRAVRPMSDAEVEAAAKADPDCQPLSKADLAKLRRTPRVKIIRRALKLTQEEFSSRYLIPLGTLRDWEQGRSEPDQPARAYLKVIASNPKAVEKALARAAE
jgi:putative transcriptional regulator